MNYFEKSSFSNLTEKINRKISKISGITHAEIYAKSVQLTEINVEQGYIKNAHKKKTAGISLRVINSEGKQGTAFTFDFSSNALEKMLDNSLKMMNASTPNLNLKDLPHTNQSYKKIEDLYDPKVFNLTLEEINDKLSPLFSLKQRDPAPVSLSGTFQPVIDAVYIWNTNGIELWDLASGIEFGINVSLLNQETVGFGFDEQSTTNWKDLNVEKVAQQSFEMAQKGLKKKSIGTGKYPVIFSPKATAQVFLEPLSEAINAEQIQNEASFLCGQLNKKIANENLTIQDNPHLNGKVGSSSFDDEGTATIPLEIITNGILRNIYHNTLTATKAGVKSNGHAFRGSLNSPISLSNHNLLFEPGKISNQNLIQDIKKGIFFDFTGDSPNLITGDFSGLIMVGYLIEDGEIGPALQETMIGLNLLDTFKQIESISKERIWFHDYFVPWIKINDMNISGRK